ncbi:unnamed protein product, partial [marine sediment metagenome]
DDYNKINKVYSTNLFVIIAIATVVFVYNKLNLHNDYVTLVLYALVIGYSVCYFFNTLYLKKILFEKKKISKRKRIKISK